MNTETGEAMAPEYTRYSPTVRALLLAAAVLACLLEVLDLTIVNVAIPTMMGNLGATLDNINWVATGYMLANVVALPMTGWMAACIGRRRLLLSSIMIFTVSSLFCGISESLSMLILFRVIQGLGGASLMSVSQAMLMDVFPPHRRGLAQAIFGVGLMAGPCAGPVLGGYLVDNYSWPWIFFINLPVGIVTVVMMWMFLKDPRNVQSATNEPIDILGISFMAIGLGCLQLMLDKGETEGWLDSSFIRWLVVLSSLGLVFFIVRELTTRYPVVNLRNLKHRGLAAGCSYAFFAGLCMMSFLMMLPVFLQNIRQYTAMRTGEMLVPFAIASAVTMPITGMLMNYISPRILTAVGSLTASYGMIMMSRVTSLTGYEHLFWGQVLFGAGIGLLFVPLMTAALAGLKGRDLAEGSGLFNLFRQLGGSIGIAYMTARLNQATVFSHNIIAEHVTIYDPEVISRLTMYKQFFMSKGASAVVATQQALKAMDQIILGQSTIIGFGNIFLLMAILFVLTTPLSLLLSNTVPGDEKVSGHH
ncbi:MAG: DHA2 family efflux MFS transporter permease subunit [Armatimonadota bacterium]|nr:DHA2 family efflux MFS transporter permease subunit [bacterium]